MANYNYMISVNVSFSGNPTGRPVYGYDGAVLILVGTGTTASAANTNLSATSVLQYCYVITGRTGTTVYKITATASTCYAAVAAVRFGCVYGFTAAQRVYTNQITNYNVTCNIGGDGSYLLSYTALNSLTPSVVSSQYKDYLSYPAVVSGWPQCAMYTSMAGKYKIITNGNGATDTTAARYYAASTAQFATGTTWHAGDILEFNGYTVGLGNSTQLDVRVENNTNRNLCLSVTIMVHDTYGMDTVILLGYYDYNVPAFETSNEYINVVDGMYHDGIQLGVRVREYNYNSNWQIGLGTATITGSGASEDYVMYNLSQDITIYSPITLRVNY